MVMQLHYHVKIKPAYFTSALWGQYTYSSQTGIKRKKYQRTICSNIREKQERCPGKVPEGLNFTQLNKINGLIK